MQRSMAADDIARHVHQSLELKNIDLIYALSGLLSNIDEGNSPMLLGILCNILGHDIDLPRHLHKSFLFYMNRILAKLRKNTHPALHCHIPEIAFRKTAGFPSAHVDVLEQIRRLVTERLIKTQKQEIANAVDLAAGDAPALAGTGGGAVLAFYLRNITGPQRNGAIKYIAALAAEEDLPALLSYFCEEPCDAELFFIALYRLNKDVYESAVSIIYAEKRFFRPCLLGALPEVDPSQVIPNIRDYNWDVLGAVLLVHPEAAAAVSSAFAEGTLKVSRHGFLERIVPLDHIFAHCLEKLGLSDDELMELCDKSTCFAQRYFTMIDTEEKMLEFCKLLAKSTDDFILNFIRSNANASNFPLFLDTLTHAMRFAGELRAYVVDRFAESEEFFHTLITYLDIEEIDRLLGLFYRPGESIEALQRKYHPQELLIELQRFRNTDVGMQLVGECLGMPSFTDRDWVFVMKSLENIELPMKMQTCRMILERRPQLRSQTVFLLRRSIGAYIWDSPLAVAGLVGCLELLGHDCVQVLEVMNRDEIIKCLSKSETVFSNLRESFEDSGHHISPRHNVLRECLEQFSASRTR